MTGLRWMAALAVFASHNVPGGETPSWIVAFFTSGYMGVTIFFVLSGFILSATYADTLSHPSVPRIADFFVARIARVYPLYLLVLVYVIAAAPSESPSWWWKHVLAIQTWSGDLSVAYGLNGVGWSIGVEFFLYLTFPVLIIVLCPLTRTLKGSLTVAVGAAVFIVLAWAAFRWTGHTNIPWSDSSSAHRWLYRSPLVRLGDFVLGLAAAAAFRHTRSSIRAAAIAPFVAAVCGIVIIISMATPQLARSAITFDALYAIPAAALIWALAIAPGKGIGRVLGSVPLVALGEMSFAFYLIRLITDDGVAAVGASQPG